MIRFTLLLWLLVLPSFGAAQQVTGTITSDAHTWYLTRLDGQSKSGWSALQGRFDVSLLFTDDFGATLDPDDTRQFSG